MDDILFMGTLAATFPNGKSATGEFCARIIFGLSDTTETRIKSFEVWAVSLSRSFTSRLTWSGSLGMTKTDWQSVGRDTICDRDDYERLEFVETTRQLDLKRGAVCEERDSPVVKRRGGHGSGGPARLAGGVGYLFPRPKVFNSAHVMERIDFAHP